MRPPLRPLFRTPIATPNPFSSKRIGARALNVTVAALLLVVMTLVVVTEANAQNADGTAAKTSSGFHLMEIEQVIGGVLGDTDDQAIQLRMRDGSQNFIQGTRLIAHDAAGLNPVVVIDFPSNVTSGAGGRILVASPSFLAKLTPTIDADFEIGPGGLAGTNLIPVSYLPAGRLTFEDSGGSIYWSVCWEENTNDYSGPTDGLTFNDDDGEFGPCVASALPSDNDEALLFDGPFTDLSTSNFADYVITNQPVFTNNAGDVGGLVDFPPLFSKSFDESTIDPGEVSTLTFEIENLNVAAVSGLDFTDNLPVGVEIANPSMAATTCTGGTLTAPDGGSTISYSSGTVGASSTCAVTVDVTSSIPGPHFNITEALTSTAGNSGTASATLTVSGDFFKIFDPSTIGPSSTSTLTFNITNADPEEPVSELAFMDVLPTGVTIATPASAFSDCEGILSAPDGDSTISLSDGRLGANESCTVNVNVTSSSPGMHTNVSGDLTFVKDFTPFNGGVATATLTVEVGQPGFSKSFSPDGFFPNTIFAGQTSTLTLTIDNTANAGAATNLAFTDNLPGGMVFATPANASTDCNDGGFMGVVTTGLSGGGPTSFVSLSTGGVAAFDFCTVTVDVTAPEAGSFVNTTFELTNGIFPTVPSGFATAAFIATGEFLTKSFTNDPVAAGATVNLEFTIINLDRSISATNISFTDNLDDVLTNLAAIGTFPMNDLCGTGNGSLDATVGNTLLEFTGGSLLPGESCTFSATLQVPVGASPDTYTNTTSALTHDAGSENQATDDLVVVSASPLTAPQLAKSFTDDPVAPDDQVTLEFTLILSNDAPGNATAIAFTDDLTFLSGLTVATSPPLSTGTCDGTLIETGGGTGLDYSGGSLSPGASCTFSVTLDVPSGAPSGSHTNTTSNVSAMVASTSVSGDPASDDLLVEELTLTKEFTNVNPVDPGDPVTLKFTLTRSSGAPDATDIFFTDNLNDALSDLAATTTLPINVCGGMLSGAAGNTLLIFSGGSLTGPSLTCDFSVTLQVPTGATPDTYVNTTSNLVAKLGVTNVVLASASDELVVADTNPSIALTKSFDDPVNPGSQVTLEFTINNGPTAVTGISFTDDLAAVLPGTSDLTAVTPLSTGTCDGSLNATVGDTFLTYSGGTLAALAFCTISVTLDVPADAPDGNYINTTSDITADGGVTGDLATDVLTIDIESFHNRSPVAKAGEDQTLECTDPNGEDVTLDGSGSSDPDDDDLTFSWTASGITFNDPTSATPTATFPLGSTTVTLTVDDGNGLTDSDEVIITVEDTTPPEITMTAGTILDENELGIWPPNHKYKTFDLDNIVVSATDACDAGVSATGVAIDKVTSDEPEDDPGSGDGNTLNDIVITGDCRSVDVRAERDGNSNGRVYTVNVEIEDASENIGTAVFQIEVPHDRNGSSIDDGPVYTVTCGESSQGQQNLLTEITTEEVPEAFVLHQNYPNPFNPETRIRFGVPETAQVTLVVYDVLGRQVRVLVDGVRQAGTYEAVFEAGNLPSGTYIYRLETPQGSFVQTMLLLK